MDDSQGSQINEWISMKNAQVEGYGMPAECSVFTAHFHSDKHRRKLLQVYVVVPLGAKDD